MNIDEKIKQQLEQEADDIAQNINDDEGLFSRLTGVYRGGMHVWMGWFFLTVTLVTVIMIWCGYRFFVAEDLQQQVFWGVLFLLSTNAQVSFKMWMFMEMNRNSTIREIKRVELAVAKLSK